MQNIKSVQNVLNVLFVCTGNTCRSPMAEIIANSFFKHAGIAARASSCGVFAVPHAPASKNAVAAVGDALLPHKSRGINFKIIEDAHLVICMTAGHKAAILAGFDNAGHKVFTFAELGFGDVPDPFGGDAAMYAACAKSLEKYINMLNWSELL